MKKTFEITQKLDKLMESARQSVTFPMVHAAEEIIEGKLVHVRVIQPQGRAIQGRHLKPRYYWSVNGERVMREADVISTILAQG